MAESHDKPSLPCPICKSEYATKNVLRYVGYAKTPTHIQKAIEKDPALQAERDKQAKEAKAENELSDGLSGVIKKIKLCDRCDRCFRESFNSRMTPDEVLTFCAPDRKTLVTELMKRAALELELQPIADQVVEAFTSAAPARGCATDVKDVEQAELRRIQEQEMLFEQMAQMGPDQLVGINMEEIVRVQRDAFERFAREQQAAVRAQAPPSAGEVQQMRERRHAHRRRVAEAMTGPGFDAIFPNEREEVAARPQQAAATRRAAARTGRGRGRGRGGRSARGRGPPRPRQVRRRIIAIPASAVTHPDVQAAFESNPVAQQLFQRCETFVDDSGEISPDGHIGILRNIFGAFMPMEGVSIELRQTTTTRSTGEGE